MKKLTKKELLEALKNYLKTNKKRRPILLAKLGFATEAEYYAYINYKPRGSKVVATKKVVTEKVKPTSKKTSSKTDTMVDYVIAFDCTGSMASYIKDVRNRVKEMVTNLFATNKNLRLKIVSFGDYCDMHGENDFGNAYQVCELTDNQNALIEFVNNSKDTGGGDGDEFYELVLRKINRETKWRTGSKRVLFLIGDAPAHNPDYRWFGKKRGINWRDEMQESIDLGLQIDTLAINPRLDMYKTLSDSTNGVFIPYSKSNNVSHVVEASTYARTSKSAYDKKLKEAEKYGDKDLIGAIKSFGKLL